MLLLSLLCKNTQCGADEVTDISISITAVLHLAVQITVTITFTFSQHSYRTTVCLLLFHIPLFFVVVTDTFGKTIIGEKASCFRSTKSCSESAH